MASKRKKKSCNCKSGKSIKKWTSPVMTTAQSTSDEKTLVQFLGPVTIRVSGVETVYREGDYAALDAQILSAIQTVYPSAVALR